MHWYKVSGSNYQNIATVYYKNCFGKKKTILKSLIKVSENLVGYIVTIKEKTSRTIFGGTFTSSVLCLGVVLPAEKVIEFNLSDYSLKLLEQQKQSQTV